MTWHRAAACVILLLGLSSFSAAQEQDDARLVSALVPGARMRVRTTSQSVPNRGLVMKATDSVMTVVGVVDGVNASELTIANADRDEVRIPLTAINSVDLSVGSKRSWLPGLGFGVLVGLIAGATAPIGDCGAKSVTFCSRGEAIGVNTLALGGTFTVIGAFFKTDRWERRFTRSASPRDGAPPTSAMPEP